jgi:site-specific recombinase XerD
LSRPSREGVGRKTVLPTRVDEYQRLFDAAPSELYRDLFVTMRYAGLRVSEAVSLRWEQVDLEALQLQITGKGNVERYVDILAPVEAVLERRYLRKPPEPLISGSTSSSPYVFPGPSGYPLSTRAVQLVMQKLRERLGIPKSRCTPHKLRHGWATEMLNRGAPLHVVSQQMGHANISTTSVYLHAVPGQLRRIVEGQ